MKKPCFDAVIFDMDGTLLYTIDDMTTGVNLAMREFGFPTHTEKEVESYVNNGARRLIELAVPKEKCDEDTVSRVLERYLYHYGEHVCEKTYPYTGICEMLSEITAAGVKCAVVSNKPDAAAKALVEKCFPAGTFAYVSGSGKDLPTKPDKACTDKALAAMGLTGTAKVLYVGDSYVDVRMAKNAVLSMIGVLWGFAGENSFPEEQPDATVRTVEELTKYIMNGK